MTDLTMSQFASKDDLLAAQAARIAELESQVQRAAEIERAAILLRVKNRAVAGALLVEDFRSIVADRGPAQQAVHAAPAHSAEGVPAQAETLRVELAEATEAADKWRRLALQFDNHRMQALGHLKAVTNPEACFDKYKAAKEFLNAPPLDGEAVLAQRIAALAATQPAAQGVEALGAHGHQERSA